MQHQPITSNPIAHGSTSASALEPQLSALSVTAADMPAAQVGTSSVATEAKARGGMAGSVVTPQENNVLRDHEQAQGRAGRDDCRPGGLSASRPKSGDKTLAPLGLQSGHDKEEQGYPSPSGAFVPSSNESARLQDPPAATNMYEGDAGESHAPSAQPLSSTAGTSHPARPTSVPSAQATSRIRRASSRAASRRGSTAATDRTSADGGAWLGSSMQSNSSRQSKRTSTEEVQSHSRAQSAQQAGLLDSSELNEDGEAASSSSSSFLAGSQHSQAISARSSPSTVGPMRRPSGGSVSGQQSGAGPSSSVQISPMTGRPVRGDEDIEPLAPLKVRDYAFPETDPRHVGAREVGLGTPINADASPTSKFGFGTFGGGGASGPAHEWSIGGIDHDDDDDEDVYDVNSESDEGSQDGLPLGLYHAAYDFIAESEHELDVKVGQRVRLVGHVDGGWAIVVRICDGEEDVDLEDESVDKGLVPEAYLQWLGP